MDSQLVPRVRDPTAGGFLEALALVDESGLLIVFLLLGQGTGVPALLGVGASSLSAVAFASLVLGGVPEGATSAVAPRNRRETRLAVVALLGVPD